MYELQIQHLIEDIDSLIDGSNLANGMTSSSPDSLKASS